MQSYHINYVCVAHCIALPEESARKLLCCRIGNYTVAQRSTHAHNQHIACEQIMYECHTA